MIKNNKPALKNENKNNNENTSKEAKTKWRRCWQLIGSELVALSAGDISAGAKLIR